MPYIGNTAGNRFVASKAATQFSGDGSNTGFTLEHSVGSDEDILVSVDGVIQEPSVAYTVSNGTTLTFTEAPSNNSGNNIFVYYLFRTVGTVSHPSSNALQATSGTFSGAVSGTTGTFSGAITGSSTITGGGLLTTGGNIVIPDAGNIGSASDTDAISISSGGTVTFSQPLVGALTTVNSGGVNVASTASVTFTGLPSGIKRIQVNLYGVSGASTDTGALIRLGTSGGIVTSGYGSISHWGGGGQSDTSGLYIYGTHTSNSINGIVTINNIGSDIFVSSHSIMYNTSNGAFGGGYKDLGGTLTQLKVSLVSGGNFDSGLINLLYEL
jgi:hypothetical protein